MTSAQRRDEERDDECSEAAAEASADLCEVEEVWCERRREREQGLQNHGNDDYYLHGEGDDYESGQGDDYEDGEEESDDEQRHEEGEAHEEESEEMDIYIYMRGRWARQRRTRALYWHRNHGVIRSMSGKRFVQS